MGKDISRRSFIKAIGGGTVAAAPLLAACTDGRKKTSATQNEPQKGKMTYRTNPNTGDKVSLLGYGMMRLPVEGEESGRENPDAPIDQDMVNR